VIDADTLEIHGERIRILGIDAPESRQPCFNPWAVHPEWRCGAAAANELSDWIGARAVTCETTRKDRYKRWLARCSVGGDDLALWLAEAGWVFPYRNCTRAEIGQHDNKRQPA
jgi:endonuclease YncB( thermonuclease family)